MLGYKFEVLSVLRQPWDSTTRAEIENRQNEVVNNSAQYCSVVKTGIGHTRMVLGGEVDAGMFISAKRNASAVLIRLNSVGLQTRTKGRHNTLGRVEDIG